LKNVILHIFKSFGIFWICRKLVRRKTLILAYHGFEILNETAFRKRLFIKKSTFKQRLDYLASRCSVIPLKNVREISDINNKVVITIDDGWDTIRTVAASCLNDKGFPYTVYLTTQNVLDNEPIFHIALDYILTNRIGYVLKLEVNSRKIDVVISSENKSNLISEIVQLKAQNNDTHLLKVISEKLNFDFDKVIETKALSLMDENGVAKLKESGADIQLHTHSHYTPLGDFEAYTYEIEENRKHIRRITNDVSDHHCYPSGRYNEKCFSYLRQLNVKTATTCNFGFCDASTNPYELPRFLDGEHIPQIIFEAEVSGVLEIMRKIRLIVRF
jgi:peptidoglycan/xylan/chitin deacetylase (PgdA/CDA1 family)